MSDNIRLTAQPSGLTQFDDLTLVTKKYVDDAVANMDVNSFQRIGYAGTPNGVISAFTLNDEIIIGTELVMLNGLGQTLTDDYTFDGTVVTFTVPPLTGNKILVYGEKGTN